jgi:hypothetical protein
LVSGLHPLDVGRDAGNQATAADTAEDGVDRLGVLAQNLHADGALAGDHFGIIERMHEGQPLALLQFQCVRVRVIVGFAGEHHLAATALDGVRP